jgi:hypothetical protein
MTRHERYARRSATDWWELSPLDEDTRTVERSKGVYQYRRPHFSTSPYFAG